MAKEESEDSAGLGVCLGDVSIVYSLSCCAVLNISGRISLAINQGDKVHVCIGYCLDVSEG
jgi:hypothetical protein